MPLLTNQLMDLCKHKRMMQIGARERERRKKKITIEEKTINKETAEETAITTQRSGSIVEQGQVQLQSARNNQQYDRNNNNDNPQQTLQSYYGNDDRRLPPLLPPPRDNYSNQGPPSSVTVQSGQSYSNSDDPRGRYVWIPC